MAAVHARSHADAFVAVRHVLDLCEGAGGRVAHDLSDPLQATFLEQLFLKGAGRTADRYPALSLQVAHRPEPVLDAPPIKEGPGDTRGAFTDGEVVDYVGTNAGTGMVKAATTFTRVDPLLRASVTLLIIDESTEQVLATGIAEEWNAQTLLVKTNDAGAQPLPEGGDVTALITYAVEYADGTQEIGSTSSYWAHLTASDPVISAPALKPGRSTGDLDDIVIGLALGYDDARNNTDLDYWFWRGSNANSTLLVPLAGYMKFQFPIAPLGPDNPTDIRFSLARREGGISELTPASIAAYRPCFSINAQDPTRLDFAMQADQHGKTAGTAIDFGVSPWVSDTTTYFTARVQVMLRTPTGLKPGWSTVMSADDPDPNPTDGVLVIKPIVYIWYQCLAKGTTIRLGDDKTVRPIEEVQVGDLVMSTGGPRKVLATIAKPSTHTQVRSILATDSNGYIRRVICSSSHPILAKNGQFRQAGELRYGDEIQYNGQPATVWKPDIVWDYDDELFNLSLDPKAWPGATLMYANGGIMVGDHQIKLDLLDGQRSDPDLIRAALPARLLTDFESSLADRARAAERGGRRDG